jgi:hypothetical protein
MQCRVGGPFPACAGSRFAHEPGLPCVPSVPLDLSSGQVAELAELPDHVVALAAVPDVGARPLGTRPSLPGAYPTAGGPVPAQGDNRIVR